MIDSKERNSLDFYFDEKDSRKILSKFLWNYLKFKLKLISSIC